MSVCLMCLRRIASKNRLHTFQFIRSYASFFKQLNGFQFEPVPDLEYLLDPTNRETIKENIKSRKGIGDIDLLHKLNEEYKEDSSELVKERLIQTALLIPNQSSPDTIPGSKGKIVRTHGKKTADVASKSFEDICGSQGLLRFQNIINSTLVYGARSYNLMGDLARLERALVHWTIDELEKKGWRYVVVPDMLPEAVVKACGFVTTGRQNQVYKVRPEQGGLCLAGTSEMSLAALHAGTQLGSHTPIKLCAYSPCYRAEEARNKIDKGFYRLHQFNKVEMFGVCMPDQSSSLLEEIIDIQCGLFSQLGLCFNLIEMPSEELGAPAYKKYDIEAWISRLKHWGEISSASNCTDYQARRLSIMTQEASFAHTVNGTGCAVPRLLMAIVEQNQMNGKIVVPAPLLPYMKLKHLRPSRQLSHYRNFIKKRPMHAD
ncbi:serine--tRNA ligase, mitochondrial-like isoform X1 [Watersipora subatra]|uniref:serine--tRNA ligase, mitochondrial-like isoform X1 n=1 Tax=Watersipora subatra TaxID=2589382 RepID=UPI00355C72DA